MSKKSNNRSIISGNFKSYDTAYLVKCTNSPIRTIELTGRYKKSTKGQREKRTCKGVRGGPLIAGYVCLGICCLSALTWLARRRPIRVRV